jgi:predicted ATP-grasp superfamily ATP-dependent carboligase
LSSIQPRGRGPFGLGRSRTPEGGPAVIVTGGEYISGLAAVRSLRAAGFAPWVAAISEGGYAARSRDRAGIIPVPDPGDDALAFVQALAAAALDVDAVAILPGTETALFALVEHRTEVPVGVAIGADPPSVTNTTDKRRLDAIAAAAGVLVPPSVEVRLPGGADALPFPYPVVVKPGRSEQRESNGNVRHFGARKVLAPDRLQDALDALPGDGALIQPFQTGPLTSIAGVFWDGALVCAVQSMSDRIWPPECGSITHAETVPLDPVVSDSVERLLRGAGFQGLFQIDAFDVGGVPVVIDLNPRIYTSLGHATQAGMNLVAIWVDLLRGVVPIVPSSYRIGVRYRHDEGDPRALLRMLRQGQVMAALRGMLPERDAAIAVFSLRDPRPSLASLDRLLGPRRPSRVERQVEVPSLAPAAATPARDDSAAVPESAALPEAAPQSDVAAVVASPVVASAIVPARIPATRGAPAGAPSILSSRSVSEGSATS